MARIADVKRRINRNWSSSTFHFAARRVDGPHMNRTGLLIALAIAVVAGLVFGLYPEIDLRIARHFYGIEDAGHNKFALRFYPPLMQARNIPASDWNCPCGAGCGGTRDQTDFSPTQVIDVRTGGGFPDRNHSSGTGFDGERAAQGALGPSTADRRNAIRRQRTFCALVGSAWRLYVELLICFRRCDWRLLDGRAGGIGSATVACVRIWCGTCARDGDGSAARDGRRSFSV